MSSMDTENDELEASLDAIMDSTDEMKPFQVLAQPLLKVLREQLGPGELDAAARVCKTWASQLAHDVVHCEMCLPGCYELLLCQLEQLAKRFKNVHEWHLWLPAGAQWGLINDLLWLLSRYKAEKLQLDGRLFWHPRCAAQLPELDNDVFPWMASMRSLQSLRLTHCTLAASSGLAYLAFLSDLHTLQCGLRVASPDAWTQEGLDPWLNHLCKLRQVSNLELHVEGSNAAGVLVLPAQLPEQVQRLFAACTKLQRFTLRLGMGWGVMRDHECVVYERAAADTGTKPAAAASSIGEGGKGSSRKAGRQPLSAAGTAAAASPRAAAHSLPQQPAAPVQAAAAASASPQQPSPAAASPAALPGTSALQQDHTSHQHAVPHAAQHAAAGAGAAAAAAAAGPAGTAAPAPAPTARCCVDDWEFDLMEAMLLEEEQEQEDWAPWGPEKDLDAPRGGARGAGRASSSSSGAGRAAAAAAAAAAQGSAAPASPSSSPPGTCRQRGGGLMRDDSRAWQRLVAQRSSISSSPRKQMSARRMGGGAAAAAAAAGTAEDADGDMRAGRSAADAHRRESGAAPGSMRRSRWRDGQSGAAAAGAAGGAGAAQQHHDSPPALTDGPGGSQGAGGAPVGPSLLGQQPVLPSAVSAHTGVQHLHSDTMTEEDDINGGGNGDAGVELGHVSVQVVGGLGPAPTAAAAASQQGSSGPLPLSLLDRELGGNRTAAAAAAAAAAAGTAAPVLGPMQLISRELGGLAHLQQQQQQQQQQQRGMPVNFAAAAAASVHHGGGVGRPSPPSRRGFAGLLAARDQQHRQPRRAAEDMQAAAAGGGGAARLSDSRPVSSMDVDAAGMDHDDDDDAPTAAAAAAAGGTGTTAAAGAGAGTSSSRGGGRGGGGSRGSMHHRRLSDSDLTLSGSLLDVSTTLKRRVMTARARQQQQQHRPTAAAAAAAGGGQPMPHQPELPSSDGALLGQPNGTAAAAAAAAMPAPAAAAGRVVTCAPAAAPGGGGGGDGSGLMAHGLAALLRLPAAALVDQGLGALVPIQQAAAAPVPAPPPPAAAPAAPPAPAAAFSGPVDPIRVLQLNRAAASNAQGVLVSQLVLEALGGPCALQHRLWQQLAGSPAVALQALDLRFAQNTPAVQGSGVFWRQLLQQMPLLAELRLSGLGACEAGFEVPHLWESIRQLQGLTHLSYNARAGSGNVVAPTPEPPEGSAAALAAVLQPGAQPEPPGAACTDKLRLDLKLMQTLTQLQKLQDLEFVGDLSDTVVTRTPLLSRMASGSSNSSSSSSRARMSSSLMDADCMDDMTVMGGGSGSGAASARQQQAGARGAASMERSGGRSSSGGGGNTGYALAAHSCKSVLTFLPQLSSLNSLVLEQWTGSFMGAAGPRPSHVTLDMAWLPAGLTCLKLSGLTLSCLGNRSYVESSGAAYAAMLLQERERNTPDAWEQASAAAAAAAEERGKAPMLAADAPCTSRWHSCNRLLCVGITPPVLLPKLTELSVAHCFGTLPAISGCLAHSTGLKVLELAFGYEAPPLSLAAIAWLWPRVTEAKLADLHNSSSSGSVRWRRDEDGTVQAGLTSSTSSRDAASPGSRDVASPQGSSTAAADLSAPATMKAHKVLPNLLDKQLTPQLVAAWLWGGGSSSGTAAGTSSSSGAAGSSSSSAAASSRVMEEISARAAAGRVTWADAAGLCQLASALPNLSKLTLQLPARFNRDVAKPSGPQRPTLCGMSGSSSSSGGGANSSSNSSSMLQPFVPSDLLGLSAAPRLRELVVELPAQLSTFDATALGIRQLTALQKLRLLDVRCTVESPMNAIMRDFWVRQRLRRDAAAAAVAAGAAGAAAGVGGGAAAAGAPGGNAPAAGDGNAAAANPAVVPGNVAVVAAAAAAPPSPPAAAAPGAPLGPIPLHAPLAAAGLRPAVPPPWQPPPPMQPLAFGMMMPVGGLGGRGPVQLPPPPPHNNNHHHQQQQHQNHPAAAGAGAAAGGAAAAAAAAGGNGGGSNPRAVMGINRGPGAAAAAAPRLDNRGAAAAAAAAAGLGLDALVRNSFLNRGRGAAVAGGDGAAAAAGPLAPQQQQQQQQQQQEEQGAQAGNSSAAGPSRPTGMTGAVGSLAQGVEQLMAAAAAGPSAPAAAGGGGGGEGGAPAAAAAGGGGGAGAPAAAAAAGAGGGRRWPRMMGAARREERLALHRERMRGVFDAALEDGLDGARGGRPGAGAAAGGAAVGGGYAAAAAAEWDAGEQLPDVQHHHHHQQQQQQQQQPPAGEPGVLQQGGHAAQAAQLAGAAPAAAAAPVPGPWAGPLVLPHAAAAGNAAAPAAGNAAAVPAGPAAAAGPEGGPAADDLLSMYIDDDFWEEESDADTADADALLRDMDEAWGAAGGNGMMMPGAADQPAAAQQPAPVVVAVVAAAAGQAGVGAPHLAPAAWQQQQQQAMAADAGGGAEVLPAAAGAAAHAPAPAAAQAAAGAEPVPAGGAVTARRRRRFKPAGLQTELRRDMPSTSVFLRILRG